MFVKHAACTQMLGLLLQSPDDFMFSQLEEEFKVGQWLCFDIGVSTLEFWDKLIHKHTHTHHHIVFCRTWMDCNHLTPIESELYYTWSFQLKKNNRRFGFLSVLGVLFFLRFLACFCGRLLGFCGFLRSFFWVSWFAGFCGRLRPKLGKHPKLPEISSRWKLQV